MMDNNYNRKFLTADEFSHRLVKGDTLLIGGFGCCGSPDELIMAIKRRYDSEGMPLSLNLLSVSGVGDGKGMGLDLIADEKIVSMAISGFWGFTPKLGALAVNGKIQAHNWPLGVLRQWISRIASGDDGFFTKVGLGTFVDPRKDGGRLNSNTSSLLSLAGKNESLKIHYPKIDCNWALLRGSYADKFGNIYFDNEWLAGSSIDDAIFTKRSKGKVIVQVEGMVNESRPHQVKIPGFLVDHIVVASNKAHHLPSYREMHVSENSDSQGIKHLIARRVAELVPKDAVYMNFGIGIPALVPRFLESEFPATVESGVIGGEPYSGLAFGASHDPQAIIDPSFIFKIYQGIGIDVAVLGFAEIDKNLCINVSKFNGVLKGAGGFIDIAYAAQTIIFCGLSRTRLGKEKFVDRVQQITIDLKEHSFANKEIYVVTEECVYEIKGGSMNQIDDRNFNEDVS